MQFAQYDGYGHVIQGGLDPDTWAFVQPPPMNTPGVYLLACVVPVSLPSPSDAFDVQTFNAIVGRDPTVGETVPTPGRCDSDLVVHNLRGQ